MLQGCKKILTYCQLENIIRVTIERRISMTHTKKMILMSLFAAIIAISSLIVIPIGAVPISLQSLAIMVTGLCLKPKEATGSVAVYILLGSVGLPIFAGGSSGIGALVGPTGGYIFGFLAGVFVISYMVRKEYNWKKALLGLLLGGLVLVYGFGVSWLAYQTKMPFVKALQVGMLIFIPGDLVKVGIALVLGQRLQRHIKY